MVSGESRESMDAWEKTWDEFVKLVNGLIDSGELEIAENVYKRSIAHKVAGARKEFLNGDEERWPASLEKALRPKHPIHEIALDDFKKWCLNYPDKARRALQAIWTEEALSVAERVRTFCDILPRSEIKGGTGTRTTIASALLMGLDVTKYPPFMTTIFESAYENTGYDKPNKVVDEAEWYRHALDFLDHFLKEAQAHSLNLRHRLDMQSVIWCFRKKPDVLPKLNTRRTKPGDLQKLAQGLLLPPRFLYEIEALLADKRQVIFQGPPGTGKTYVAQELANCLARYEERVTLVQFHPSYAYEDFVRGFRPTLRKGQPGFTLQDGPLLRAAEQASKEKDAKHFLIIDEINRGNLAKVFGELYFLLEYRDKSIRMQYQQENEENFSLPKNLYIIGTMNTADRSIALVDLALRRRFYFVEFHPDDEPVKGVLGRWLDEHASEMKGVAKIVQKANELLKDDRHAAIGPSYFMKDSLNRTMVERIWKHSVIPYIEERLFGDENRIEEFEFGKICTEVAPELLPTVDEEQNDDEALTTPNGAINAEHQS